MGANGCAEVHSDAVSVTAYGLLTSIDVTH